MNKEIRKCDIFMIFIFLFIMGTRILTVFMMSHTAEVTKASIEDVVEVFEANPVAKTILNLRNSSYMLTFLVIPAMGLTLYIYYRKKVQRGKINPESFGYYILFLFFVMLSNFLNDLVMVLGRLL